MTPPESLRWKPLTLQAKNPSFISADETQADEHNLTPHAETQHLTYLSHNSKHQLYTLEHHTPETIRSLTDSHHAPHLLTDRVELDTVAESLYSRAHSAKQQLLIPVRQTVPHLNLRIFFFFFFGVGVCLFVFKIKAIPVNLFVFTCIIITLGKSGNTLRLHLIQFLIVF